MEVLLARLGDEIEDVDEGQQRVLLHGEIEGQR